MAAIKIDDITPSGAELFVDSENFMEELSNDELLTVLGGRPMPIYNQCGDIVSYYDADAACR